MPINLDIVGFKTPVETRTWTSTDCLLYSLSVGAGADDPTQELAFTTENTAGVDQRALPTMAVVLGTPRTSNLFDLLGDVNPAMALHGSQGITLHRELPVEGTLETVSEITGIYDKGTGALITIVSTCTVAGTGEPLFELRSSMFQRGEGGFGGDRGPSEPKVAQDGPPDHEVTYRTRVDQALLYRLNGDRNPLHSDPAFAAAGGFDRPILHGLCTYGFTGRALLHSLCGGDPAGFRSVDCRFTSPVMPGEALTTRVWRTDDHAAVFQTLGEDGRVVFDSGRCTLVA